MGWHENVLTTGQAGGRSIDWLVGPGRRRPTIQDHDTDDDNNKDGIDQRAAKDKQQ